MVVRDRSAERRGVRSLSVETSHLRTTPISSVSPSTRSLVIGAGSAVQRIRAPVSTVSVYRADRASSVSRIDGIGSGAASGSSYLRVQRPPSRASSVSRAGSVSRVSSIGDSYVVEPSSLGKAVLVTQPVSAVITPSRASSRARSLTRGDDGHLVSSTLSSGAVARRPVKIFFANGAGVSANALPRRDQLREVSLPADAFGPRSHVRVITLPSGAKATAYEEEHQYGQGDHSLANVAIDDLIARTSHLQDSMMTLEHFVRRNRQLFPEDTVVYQKVTFFELTEEQLREVSQPLYPNLCRIMSFCTCFIKQ